jgi:hypothetical protein
MNFVVSTVWINQIDFLKIFFDMGSGRGENK